MNRLVIEPRSECITHQSGDGEQIPSNVACGQTEQGKGELHDGLEALKGLK